MLVCRTNEARVDGLGQGHALGRLESGIHALVTDTDRVLCDRTSLSAAADGIHLLLARVITNHGQLAGHVQFLHGVQHADDRTFVGAK